jgi:FMN phosphatase YigB (HAD superfamily)
MLLDGVQSDLHVGDELEHKRTKARRAGLHAYRRTGNDD